MPERSFESFGRYKIQRVLGKGAMGVVYEGLDPRLNRKVAIKTILVGNLDEATAKDYSKRFAREAQAVARLNHPNIVQVYDFGEEGDVAYIVMEYVRGRELKSSFDAGERFEIGQAVRLMTELLGAMDFAHNAGVIHRDIKPANVMVDGDGHAKLADFGVARISDPDSQTGATQAGTMVGTPAYMSPEQIQGQKIDRRTDIFSAGVILYQFLTGQRPFQGGGAWTMAKKIVHEDPPAPSSLIATVTPGYDQVVYRALAKQPDNRYQSAQQFADDLQRVLKGLQILDWGEESTDLRTIPSITPALSDEEVQRGTEVELEFWRAIKDTDDPEELELYLQEFPQGVYSDLARDKIAVLRRPAGQSAEDAAKAIKAEKLRLAREEQERKQREAAAKAKREAEEKARRDAEERARREAEAKAKLEAEEKARREAEEKARREAEERARLEAQEKARREAVAKAKRDAEEKARLEALVQARREAEEKARREAEAKAKREAEEKARREAEERARLEALEKARREAEERARREAEEKARREAEEKARREAEEKARREAEEKARREAEEKARREAEEKARREAEEKARREAEEKARREAEEKARREAEEKARREAEELARLKAEAEARARREAEERARLEAEAKARREAEERAKREAEEKARREAEERAQREAAELAKREAAERAMREAAELVRLEAEAKAKREAEEAARLEAEARALRDSHSKALREAEKKAARAAEVAARREAKEKKRREAEEQAAREATENALRETQLKATRDEEERARKEAEAWARREAAEAKLAAEAAAVREARGKVQREHEAKVKLEVDALLKQQKEFAAAGNAPPVPEAGKAGGVGKKLSSALFGTFAGDKAAGKPPVAKTALEQAKAFEAEGRMSEAVQFFKQAANEGSTVAARRLGQIFSGGSGDVPADPKQSVRWFAIARALEADASLGKKTPG